MNNGWYGRWMYRWETRLTTQDENRIVRPMEWGFAWLADFSPLAAEWAEREARGPLDMAAAEQAMNAVGADIAARGEQFFGYRTPDDFQLEERYPQLYPTNVRPETLAQDAEWKRKADAGEISKAKFLRFTSPVRTMHPENDRVNARWYEAPAHTEPGRPRQAIVVMPQWNADAFSHNSLCSIFNKFGVSALRLSKPYHDVRRPAELERADYAVSANIGRTIASARQAAVDIRACLDWLTAEGYEHMGVLGTSLGSCYGFLASAHDARLRVNAFNHASTWFGDVVWDGQSTRHIRAAFEAAGFAGDSGKERLRDLWRCVSPPQYIQQFAAKPKSVLVIYADYDLTFPRALSLDVIQGFRDYGLNFDHKVLPCGHYTTGETPFKYMDGWWLGSYVHSAYKKLREEKAKSAVVEQSLKSSSNA